MGDQMKLFLALANRQKLMAHSDPLPEGEAFTVYRGVQEGGDFRGVSWTLDLDVAREFAFRIFNFTGVRGTVYKTTIRRPDVYAYVGDTTGRQGEKELLLILPSGHLIEVLETREANVAS